LAPLFLLLVKISSPLNILVGDSLSTSFSAFEITFIILFLMFPSSSFLRRPLDSESEILKSWPSFAFMILVSKRACSALRFAILALFLEMMI